MRPKGKLFALLAIFVAIGLVTATGAFTSVSATRTAEVNVAGDSAALLQLQPHDSPNGFGAGVNPGAAPDTSYGYAELDEDGELRINFDGFQNDNIGTGVNLNATTDIQGVFNITNQGTQSVAVNISDAGDNNDLVTFYNSSFAELDGGLESDDDGTRVILDPGETLVVSIQIDTEGESLEGAELVDAITIEASTDITSGSPDGGPEGGENPPD